MILWHLITSSTKLVKERRRMLKQCSKTRYLVFQKDQQWLLMGQLIPSNLRQRFFIKNLAIPRHHSTGMFLVSGTVIMLISLLVTNTSLVKSITLRPRIMMLDMGWRIRSSWKNQPTISSSFHNHSMQSSSQLLTTIHISSIKRIRISKRGRLVMIRSILIFKPHDT